MKTVTLFCLISLLVLDRAQAATISFANITSTNTAKTNDLLLLDSTLGVGHATRTITVANLASTALTNYVTQSALTTATNSAVSQATNAAKSYVDANAVWTNSAGNIQPLLATMFSISTNGNTNITATYVLNNNNGEVLDATVTVFGNGGNWYALEDAYVNPDSAFVPRDNHPTYVYDIFSGLPSTNSTKVLYNNGEGTYGIRSVTGVNNFANTGAGIGLLGYGYGFQTTVGVSGKTLTYSDPSQVGIAVAGVAQDFVVSGASLIGGAFLVSYGNYDLTPTSSALLVDNMDTGLPLITARTNNGTIMFQVPSDGSITTGGNTNRWIFSGVTNGAPDVSVDGTHYPLAPLASPALTGTPTINGQSVEGELTNKVAKAGDTMTGRLAFSGTTQPGIQLNNLTTTQRDALTGVNTNSGSLLWNTTQQRMNVHNGSAWTDGFVRLAGDTMSGNLVLSPYTGGLVIGAVTTGTVADNGVSIFAGSGASSQAHPFRIYSGASSLGTISADASISFGTPISYFNGTIWITGTSDNYAFTFNNDTTLRRDAANTLALRNGASAQTLRLYNTYTDTSNYERLGAGWSGNVFNITTEAAGTGQAGRGIKIAAGGSAYLQLDSVATLNGHLLFASDNTKDIGASGANRPRNVYVASDIGANGAGARNIFAASGGAGQGFWVYSTAAGITVDANTHLQLKSTGDLVQFGGATASFAALKRNGDNLEVRLADDSNYASLALRNLKGGNTKVLTSAAAADFLYVSVPNTNAIGGDVIWEVVATDGSETQSQTGRTRFDAVAKSTTVTAGLNTMTNNAVVTAGTLTVAIASNVTTNNVWALGVTATTSLTTTNLLIKWRLETPSTFTINSL